MPSTVITLNDQAQGGAGLAGGKGSDWSDTKSGPGAAGQGGAGLDWCKGWGVAGRGAGRALIGAATEV